jgi:N-carbamoylputrescine amidase
LWFLHRARRYGRQGIQVLLCPRATPSGTVDKWLAGGRVAAVVSGAYCLSSNLSGKAPFGAWGGMGWVIEPEDGTVIATTTPDHPFVTVEIDPTRADTAKSTYPRYVLDEEDA